MGFLARTRKLLEALAESDELNIDENNMADEDIKQVIMIDPRAMELLKVLENRKKAAVAVTDPISSKEKCRNKNNGLKKYKASSNEINIPDKKHGSLEEMTNILKGKEMVDD